MTCKAFDLTQIFIALLFVFLDYNNIDFSSWSARGLAFTLAWIRALFGKLSPSLFQSWAQQAELTTTTTIIISRSIGGFFDLEIFLIFKVYFFQSVVMKIASITLLCYGGRLTDHFNFDISIFFNDLLLVIEIPILFVKVGLYQWFEAILKITSKQFIRECDLHIEFF